MRLQKTSVASYTCMYILSTMNTGCYDKDTIVLYVTVSAKTVLNGTFSITRKTNLKYSSSCSSVVLDFSHARLTV